MFLIDSHCHIDKLNYILLHKNVEDVLKKSDKNNVKSFLTISTSINNFYKIKKLFSIYNNIFYSCGIHPCNCKKELNNYQQEEDVFSEIEKLSNNKRVIAIGETGLDYYHSEEHKDMQKKFFREHIRISVKLKKPIIIHARNSINDVIKILNEENSKKCIGVLHSFNADKNIAFKLLDMGFYISFSGIITFKKSIELHDIIKKIPLDRILIETDSPYLSPIPYRGQENQPAYLIEVAKKISFLKNTKIENIALILRNNFHKLFNIK